MFFAACTIYATTNTAEAYLTTNQETLRVGNATLFLIDYAFGTKAHDLTMPMAAQEGTERKDGTLMYEVRSNTGNRAEGQSYGVILSDAETTNDGLYRVPKGTRETFRLAVLFIPKKFDEKYDLYVTQLPFAFENKQQLQLNPSELQYYTTRQDESEK